MDIDKERQRKAFWLRKEGMSACIDDIKKEYQAHVPEVAIHLAKVYLFTKSQSYDYWKKQIWSFLNKISSIKVPHKYPDKDKMWEWFEDTDGDHPYRWLCQAEGEYTSVSLTSDDMYPLKDEFANYVLWPYFQWLNRGLSEKGSVSESEVSQQIDYLISQLNRPDGPWNFTGRLKRWRS